MQNKKLLSTGPRKTQIIDCEMPELKPNGLIIKNRYCGVCMSEHYDWENAKEGRAFGHEPVGEVFAVGEDVEGFKVGDRVGGLWSGASIYAPANAKNVFKLSDKVTDEQAILEPLACLISAVSKTKMTIVGERVAVVGCGFMGCGAISLLKMRGAYVVGVDVNEEALKMAKRYGADEVYTPDTLPEHYEDIPGKGLSFRGKEGCGFRLVMEWGETDESLDLALRMTRMCGQLAIGAYHTGPSRTVNMQMMNVKAIDCLSTHPREADFNIECTAQALNFLTNTSWNYKSVPTKIYPITKFDLAHEELPNKFGKWMKALVDWNDFDGEPYML